MGILIRRKLDVQLAIYPVLEKIKKIIIIIRITRIIEKVYSDTGYAAICIRIIIFVRANFFKVQEIANPTRFFSRAQSTLLYSTNGNLRFLIASNTRIR